MRKIIRFYPIAFFLLIANAVADDSERDGLSFIVGDGTAFSYFFHTSEYSAIVMTAGGFADEVTSTQTSQVDPDCQGSETKTTIRAGGRLGWRFYWKRESVNWFFQPEFGFSGTREKRILSLHSGCGVVGSVSSSLNGVGAMGALVVGAEYPFNQDFAIVGSASLFGQYIDYIRTLATDKAFAVGTRTAIGLTYYF